MGNSCNQCGNKLPQGAKFCTKCGNPVPENEQVNATEKVQETMDKFRESAENVSTAVKEKTKQAVQQSQEFIQSEQFQNAKNEAVKNTKNFIQRFFECNINSQEDFTRAEQRRKRCLCVIFAMIAATIFLFSFYDEYCWYNGMWYSIMKFASFLSITSRVLVIPVCIIAFIKYTITNKEIKRYQSEYPDVQTHDMRMNKKAMLITLAVCIVCVPVVSKINDIAYQNDTYSASSDVSEENKNTQKSNLVEKSDNEYGMRFNMTLDEFISRYNDIVNKQEEDEFTRKSMYLEKSDFEALAQMADENNVMITTYINYNTQLANLIEPHGYGISFGVESETGKIRSVDLLFTTTYWNKITETGHRRIMNRDIPYMYMAINPSLTYEEAHDIIAKLVDNTENKSYLYYYDSNYLYLTGEDSVQKLFSFQVRSYSDEVYNKFKQTLNQN